MRSAGRWRGYMASAALLLGLAPLAQAQTTAPAAGGADAAWRQLYEDGQTIYYVDAAAQRQAGGPAAVTSLLEYKVPQVIGGAQVWSIVTHMQINCDQNRMITSDNTLYAAKMGGGQVVEAQPSNDSWHTPQPGTLGGLVWTAVCAKP